MFSIYIHIPFCIQKCLYCDFLSFPAGEDGRKSYLDALHAEIKAESQQYHNRKINTIFIGGGTPSVLRPEQTQKLFETIRDCFHVAPDAEITTELNPGTITEEKLNTYRRIGINRLSIGLQSADNGELKKLGRIHTWQDFTACWQMARDCGFANMSVDLMSGLPGQKEASWESTLQQVCNLPEPPEHLSAYSLIIEENTPFYERYHENGPEASQLPDEDEDRLMYHRTRTLLEEYGYRRYEISNYAKPGYVCRHNEACWRRMDYAGFGLGASSMVDNIRWKNETSMEAYVKALNHGKSVKQDIQPLTRTEQMEEFCFLGLRLSEGISRRAFEAAFGVSLEKIYGSPVKKLKEQGLLTEDSRIRLTEYGTDLGNYVFTHFLQD